MEQRVNPAPPARLAGRLRPFPGFNTMSLLLYSWISIGMTEKKREIRPVRVLPEDVANKIAAGEVVERPGSVVKELIENALDAGASRIIVRLVAAGRRTIEVIDNGHGMGEQDALLAIERHATSKIRKADDIDISVCNNTLTISGEKKETREEKDKGYYYAESSYGSFRRDVSLPAEVDANKVEATCKDGVLSITLPKAARSKAVKVQIKD